jgi:hypothetical protein
MSALRSAAKWRLVGTGLSVALMLMTGVGAPSTAEERLEKAAIRLAIFEFELEDTSAGDESTGETASDATGLADATDSVRQLLAQSGAVRCD